VELPADASDIRVTSTSVSGEQVSLAVQAPVTATATAFGKRLWADPGTQFVLVGSEAVAPGSYTIELAFTMPAARAFREKVLYTALIACGHSKYVQPIRPLVSSMARVPALTIQPSSNPSSLSVPHLFGGIRSYGEATRTLSCAR
jgi:hypothetical protein